MMNQSAVVQKMPRTFIHGKPPLVVMSTRACKNYRSTYLRRGKKKENSEVFLP